MEAQLLFFIDDANSQLKSTQKVEHLIVKCTDAVVLFASSSIIYHTVHQRVTFISELN